MTRRLTLILIICFVFSTKSLCQINSGEVIYKATKINKATTNARKDAGYLAFEAKIYKIIPDLQFSLKFNRVNSKFSLIKGLSIDLNEFYTKNAVRIAKGNRIFFTDLNKKILLEEMTFMNEELIIESPTDALKWELTKDSKKIGQYLCFKAITSKVIYDKNNKEQIYYFTVWYCPEIPFQYGPFDFQNLPGLILEYSNSEFVYSATSIKLDKETIEIQPPVDGKRLTRTEFEEKGKQAYENRRN